MSSSTAGTLKYRILISAILILVFLGLGVGVFQMLLSRRSEPEQTGTRKPRVVVRTETAERRGYQERLAGFGKARALRAVEVAAELAGLVEWTAEHLEAGEAAREGEVLLRLDPREFRQTQIAAAARKVKADATVVRLQKSLESLAERLVVLREEHATEVRELERVAGLTELDILSQSEFDRQRITANLRQRQVLELEWQEAAAQQDLIQAEAEVAVAAADLAQAELDLSRTEIRAPFPGRIEARHVSVGSHLAPGTAVFSIVDLARVEVPILLGASHFDEVSVGAAATLSSPGTDRPLWSGPVSRISPTVNDRDRTFLVYLEIEGTPLSAPIPPGAFVEARIDGLHHEDVIPLPRIAFSGDRVYVADPVGGGEALLQERIPVLARLLPEVGLVAERIEAGERIVVTNLEQIADGSRVLLVAEETEPDSRTPAVEGTSPPRGEKTSQ